MNQQTALIVDDEPDILCLTDMRLPDGNGIDLVRHITQNYPQTPTAIWNSPSKP